MTRFATFLLALFALTAYAQPRGNYDESNVGTYTLPDPLLRADGQRITRASEWENSQRQYVLGQFKQYVYGEMPGPVAGTHYVVQRVDSAVLGGKAMRKFVRVFFGPDATSPHMDVMLYLPRNMRNVPMFVTLNYGNHTTSHDSTIPLPERSSRIRPQPEGAPAPRGRYAHRWPVEQLIDAGVGLAMADYADLEPDTATGWQTGIRTTLQAQTGLKPEQWSALGAWAWGMSRILDYLKTDRVVDARRVILQGHSRLGKAALWAGANDPRFAAVISNESGEGGAALARRNYGETIRHITTSFPHWFLPRYATYADRAADLPVDQHELLALIAPRPLCVASAEQDRWADPRGEFLSLKASAPVWNLYGKNATFGDWPGLDWPPADQPVQAGSLRYYVRTGQHDVLPYDWTQYLAFARAVGLLR